jgi:tetratricopeptide (TPR) repeat protein
MWYWVIPVLVLGVCLLGILFLLLKQIPKLRIINADSLAGEKTRKLKEQIVLQRLTRVQEARLGRVWKRAGRTASRFARLGRLAVQKVYAIEQYYEKLQKTQGDGVHRLDQEAVRRLFDEADVFVKKEAYLDAEKRFIEIISHYPKHAEAYEQLGNLYLLMKQFPSARESLSFALRLAPADASVLMSLAELETAEHHPLEALGYVRQAVERRPTNPKYLDAYIEAAFSAKQYEEAKKGLALLKAANPENTKIADWESLLPLA